MTPFKIRLRLKKLAASNDVMIGVLRDRLKNETNICTKEYLREKIALLEGRCDRSAYSSRTLSSMLY